MEQTSKFLMLIDISRFIFLLWFSQVLQTFWASLTVQPEIHGNRTLKQMVVIGL